jgi:hypothetical protein
MKTVDAYMDLNGAVNTNLAVQNAIKSRDHALASLRSCCSRL